MDTMTVEVEIVEETDRDLSNSMLVLGLPGEGLTGNIAAAFLAETFEMEKLLEVHSRAVPPLALVDEGQVTSPLTGYLSPMKCGPDGECDQLVVIPSYAPLDPKHLHSISTSLLDWVEEKEIDLVVVLLGLKREALDPEGIKVYAAASTGELDEVLQDVKARVLTGSLSGLGAKLILDAKRRGQGLITFLAETHGEYPDARAAARLLESVQPLVPRLEIDPEPLFKTASAIEERARESLDKHKESMSRLKEEAEHFYE